MLTASPSTAVSADTDVCRVMVQEKLVGTSTTAQSSGASAPFSFLNVATTTFKTGSLDVTVNPFSSITTATGNTILASGPFPTINWFYAYVSKTAGTTLPVYSELLNVAYTNIAFSATTTGAVVSASAFP